MALPNPAIVNDSFAVRLGLLYGAILLAAGWHMPLFPVWLAARGLDPAAIGIVLAASQLVRIVAMPAGTRLADRHGSLVGAITVATLASVAALAILANVGGFAAILAAVIVLGLVSAPIMPLTDAYALKGLALRRRSYGPVRLWGSITFIAANLSGGLLLGLLAPSHLIWLIFAGHCAVLAAAFLLVPQPRDEPAPQRAAARHGHLRQPAFLAIAAASSLIQASHAVFYGFATLDWTAKGYSGPTIGVLWALGVAAEIVLFAYAERITKIGPVALIAIGAVGAMLRWGATALDPPLALLAPLQMLHAFSFGATHLGTMLYLGQHAPEGSRATAQGDVATANSVMMAAASAITGVMYAASGSLAYVTMAAMALVGAGFAAAAARLTRA